MSRYIKIYTHNWVKAGDSIVKKDLVDIANGMAEWLIDSQNDTYFDKETNTWKSMDKMEDSQREINKQRRNMKPDKIRDIVGSVVGIVGVIVWFIETWSFGWNNAPKNKEEVILNMVAWCLIVIGFFIRPTRVDNNPTNIKTNTVELINK